MIQMKPCVAFVCLYFNILTVFFNNFFKDWSEDGQLLGLATINGTINCFLTKLPLLASVYQRRIAFMTSLKEISIYDHLSKTKVSLIKSIKFFNKNYYEL
jgi:hypothetical protein